MTKLNENVGSVEYDELINSAEPKADVFNVTLRAQAAETILKRGTVLALSDADNKVVVLGTSAKTFAARKTASWSLIAPDTLIATNSSLRKVTPSRTRTKKNFAKSAFFSIRRSTHKKETKSC